MESYTFKLQEASSFIFVNLEDLLKHLLRMKFLWNVAECETRC